MKLEIELDLNQIDYDAINKQIQDKIADMDLHKEYHISSKIDSKIREEVEERVNRYLGYSSWAGLNDSSKREIKDEIAKNVRELIKPHVENIFNQIPQEELDTIISELIPKVLVDIFTSEMKDMIANYYYSSQNSIMQFCEDRIHNILNR